MHVGTHAPSPATSRVSGTPVGTEPPSVRQTPNESAPCTIWLGASVLVNDQLSTSEWSKPTLICVTLSASANTYTSYAVGSSVSERPTTAGGGSVLKYTAGCVRHGVPSAATQLGSTGETTYVLIEP